MELESLAADLSGNGQLDIAPRTNLLVQIEAVEGNLRSQLVGVVGESHVVITMPRSNLRIDHNLFHDKHIIVRYLNQGALYSFQSQILDTITRPVPLMFLRFPRVVSRQDLRRHKRVDCFLPSSAELSGRASNGFIVNISRGGCLFVTSKKNGSSFGAVPEGAKLGLSFKMIANQNQGAAQAVIRSKGEKQEMMLLGLEFEQIDPVVQAEIDTFVTTVDQLRSVCSE